MPEVKKVLVTGGSGYMGLHIIHQLLERGHVVHTTSRNLNSKKSKLLHELKQKYTDKLHLFEADLLKEGSFLEAMRTVDAVIHTASPIIYKSKNPYEDVVKPAVEGTNNVLNSCVKTSTVRTIVVTSSAAAVFSGSPDPNHTYTEADFNKVSTMESETYYYSKTQAELEVYKFKERHGDRFRIVTLAPCFCFGPNFSLKQDDGFSIDDESQDNSGLKIIKGWIKIGTQHLLKNGVLAVDIRDVALAHIKSVEMPQVEGRFLLIEKKIDWDQVKQLIVENTTVKLNDLQPDNCGRGSGIIAKFDNSKSKNVLKLNYTPVEVAVVDTIKQLKEYRL